MKLPGIVMAAALALAMGLAASAGRGAPSAEEEHPTIAREEEAARIKILNSPEWHEILRGIEDWLSVQKTYDKSEVAQFKHRFNQRVMRMSSHELIDFMSDLQEKLKVLLSPEARSARVWMGQYLALHAAIPPDQFKKMRPDILHMTSEQMEERLQTFEAKEAQTKQTQAAFDKGREQQVQAIEAWEKQQHDDEQKALDRAYEGLNNGAYGGFGGYSNPGPYRGFRW